MRLRHLALLVLLLAGLVVPITGIVQPPVAAAVQLNRPVVGMASTPSGQGYWLVASDGGIFAFGDAAFLGSTGGTRLNQPIVGMQATPSGNGYWLVARDGGIFTFGDAAFLGATGNIRLNQPIVGMSATPSGNGYWLVARDGGIFTFGDAAFLGSTGNTPLNQPIVGMSATPSGNGYWLVASDGGIFTFGDAAFLGSTGNIRLNEPIVGMAATPSSQASGQGYWLVARDGGIFTFGDATYLGSTGNIRLNEPIVGMAATPSGQGYWLGAADGGIFTFGDAPFHGSPQQVNSPPPPSPPSLQVTTLVSGLAIPWDLGFTPDGTMLFTERAGRLRARLPDGTLRQLADISADLFVSGETGLLGLAIDPGFASNRTIYTCATNNSPREVRVMKWSVNADFTAATRTANPLVGGIPSTATIHNGCRPRFGPDGLLWIGTGDSAGGPNPQGASLGGKVLRVNPADGTPAAGNPSGTHVFTSGHRNVQGLALRPGTDQMFSVEHGPDRDDEINLLRAGGNAGWDPNRNGSYDQSVPMTDTNKFPNAIRPTWSSGVPTLATSGATFVSGAQWGSWNGALVVACLKASKLEVFTVNAAGTAMTSETSAVTNQGRLRSPVQGPDGSLYVTTSNGSNDKILRVTPS
jgi:glucose/arabinose dehydrogenase